MNAERQTTAWALIALKPPALPCVVSMTRVAPSNGLDDDNLAGSLKGIRDEIAKWLGVDDRDARMKFKPEQRRGKRGEYAVEISIVGAA